MFVLMHRIVSPSIFEIADFLGRSRIEMLFCFPVRASLGAIDCGDFRLKIVNDVVPLSALKRPPQFCS
jgi:hypothetical protein